MIELTKWEDFASEDCPLQFTPAQVQAALDVVQWTPAQMAEAMGVSAQTVRNWLKNGASQPVSLGLRFAVIYPDLCKPRERLRTKDILPC